MTGEIGDSQVRKVSRRRFFKQVGAAAALAGTPLVARSSAMAQEQAPPETATSQLEALETLTAAEADILEAIVARLIPSDENGPGAAEARAARYIDRALTGALHSWHEAYAASRTCR